MICGKLLSNHINSPALCPATYSAMNPTDPEPNDRSEEFLMLLGTHERQLALYVYGLVPDNNDAEDILQESRMVMWRSFSQFKTGTNFIAWARKVAFHQVLTYRRKKKRSHLQLSDEMLELMATEIEKLSPDIDHRRDRLESCLRKLPSAHRSLVLLRYYEEKSIEDMAEQLDKTETAVYRALSRIRHTLMQCVSNQPQSQS